MVHNRFAILGAGPIGIEAALRLRAAGETFALYERASAGAHVSRWAHTRMFSPWSYNISAAGLAALDTTVATFDGGVPDACPTGGEYVERYLQPLAALLGSGCHFGTTVVRVGRRKLLKGDAIGEARRGEQPFRLLLSDPAGHESVASADVVLDCTGVYGQPCAVGEGGVPAPGERAAGSFIHHDMPDVLGAERAAWSGRSVLLVGAGHSAATSALALATLTREAPGTRVVWAARHSTLSYPARPDDPLPERYRLESLANALVTSPPTGFELRPGSTVDSMKVEDGRVCVTLTDVGDNPTQVMVDRIVAHVGFQPDRDLYRELQVQECYATAGPTALAAILLGEASADCLSQPQSGVDLLRHPDPGFFVLGMKSYGRNPAFLIRTGIAQIDTVLQSLGVSAVSPVPAHSAGAR